MPGLIAIVGRPNVNASIFIHHSPAGWVV